MSKFKIVGGKQLSGEVVISGSKNSSLPLMAACLLTEETCTLTNVPEIEDVQTMIEILRQLGAEVDSTDKRLVITAKALTSHEPDSGLVSRFRGSLLLLGALLGRLGKVTIVNAGGDKIGVRPIEAHVEALKALGAKYNNGNKISLKADKLVGAKIVLEESSVTATENAMMAAVLASGTTVIKLAAMEPHIQQLGEFLNQMGAKISGIGSPTLTIQGVAKLHGAKIEVIPDSEEATSFITLAAAARSDIVIKKLNPEFLDDYFLKLKKIGVKFEVGEDFVHVFKPENSYYGIKIQCGLFPKLNSDFVPPMAVLATQAEGETTIDEWLYENRLGYIPKLADMGAKAEILDPHRVRIIGPTKLHAKESVSFDLRMGMTLVIAALIAEGTSEISDIHHIDRGYAKLEERLKVLGADIERID
jgi:UDP-N-acetylglucosamine 1-carboxyvinyltransferase